MGIEKYVFAVILAVNYSWSKSTILLILHKTFCSDKMIFFFTFLIMRPIYVTPYNWDSNPHSADQKHHSMNPVHLTTRPEPAHESPISTVKKKGERKTRILKILTACVF